MSALSLPRRSRMARREPVSRILVIITLDGCTGTGASVSADERVRTARKGPKQRWRFAALPQLTPASTHVSPLHARLGTSPPSLAQSWRDPYRHPTPTRAESRTKGPSRREPLPAGSHSRPPFWHAVSTLVVSKSCPGANTRRPSTARKDGNELTVVGLEAVQALNEDVEALAVHGDNAALAALKLASHDLDLIVLADGDGAAAVLLAQRLVERGAHKPTARRRVGGEVARAVLAPRRSYSGAAAAAARRVGRRGQWWGRGDAAAAANLTTTSLRPHSTSQRLEIPALLRQCASMPHLNFIVHRVLPCGVSEARGASTEAVKHTALPARHRGHQLPSKSQAFQQSSAANTVGPDAPAIPACSISPAAAQWQAARRRAGVVNFFAPDVDARCAALHFAARMFAAVRRSFSLPVRSELRHCPASRSAH